MTQQKVTRLVRVGHDFVPSDREHSYRGFRSKGSFAMEMTQDEIDFLGRLRSLQIQRGVAGCPIIEIIPEEASYEG